MANIGAGGWTEIDWICDTAQTPQANNFNRYCDWFDWHTEQIDYEREVKKVTSAKRGLGWSAGLTMKRIACMPLHLFVCFKRMDPAFGTNTEEGRKLMHKLIQRRPEFSVPQS